MPLLAGADGEKSKVGIAYDHTFGLNWQMSQTFRVVFNYILSNDEYKYGALNKSGNVSVYTTSVQRYFSKDKREQNSVSGELKILFPIS